jgi:Tfp pilus assembly protein PilX
MKARNTFGRRRTETGIALLISIFILLLISVVAIALIVSSGTESALAGNYRSSTGVY